ncbi:MAG: altronate dehydratase [Rhodothermales bacterium]|jgi:altronate dehydratase
MQELLAHRDDSRTVSAMSSTPLEEIARIAAPDDNVGVAVHALPSGMPVSHAGSRFSLSRAIPLGHRFSLAAIPRGGPLLSWGLPFGIATEPIFPGDYLCPQGVIDFMRDRDADMDLPEHGNFEEPEIRLDDHDIPFKLGEQVPAIHDAASFLGFARSANRGIGTRNYIVVFGLSANAAGFAKQLAAQSSALAENFPRVDGIVAVAHTEGSSETAPNNREMLLRTLAGLITHPNIGASLILEAPGDVIRREDLLDYMEGRDYALDAMTHAFLSIDAVDTLAERGHAIIRDWLPRVNAEPRTPQPLSGLNIAMQCGGSDAFSGISGNPLAAGMVREVVARGGRGIVAETSELVGAERYLLANVRTPQVAAHFLRIMARFKNWADWHGQSVASNPSVGNVRRGLYNITVKSIGAAMKKAPDLRLDYAIDFATPARAPGYYFMDSPGNDLESIAGEVASGSNLILFVTGNGSITNFPFVPTLKIVTTTARYELLAAEMDINAGAYLEGTPMPELVRDNFAKLLETASGARVVGESAGHSQVSFWRDWAWNSRPTQTPHDLAPTTGQAIRPPAANSAKRFRAFASADGPRAQRLGLILPTSLCAGHVASLIADKLNAEGIGQAAGIDRIIALPHTEGCGVSVGPNELLYQRCMIGHLLHPHVAIGLLLEHGCEKTTNGYFRHALSSRGANPDHFGWASIQQDGGLAAVTDHVRAQFAEFAKNRPCPLEEDAEIATLCIGAYLERESPDLIAALQLLLAAGASVIVADSATARTSWPELQAPSLAYAQRDYEPGLHLMESPAQQPAELLTGLAACGADVILTAGQRPLPGQVLAPVLHAEDWAGEDIVARVIDTASRRYTPIMNTLGNTSFQVPRGQTGISM